VWSELVEFVYREMGVDGGAGVAFDNRVNSRVGGLKRCTEVQGISFVGSTSEVCCPHPLCNLQNLCPVPP